jgi:hypothetical protein
MVESMKRFFLVILFLTALSCPSPGHLKDKIGDEKGLASLRQCLGQIRGSEGGRIIPVADTFVSQAFPTESFFVLTYPQYPVARALPESLKYNNLVVVKSDGKVELLSDINALEAFYRSDLAPVENGTEAKTAVKTWLRLTQEFYQDGFFQFSIPDRSLSLTSGRTGIKVSGKTVVIPNGGNKGEIIASLIFDQTGRLAKVLEKANVVAGPRPICQATKLIDPDPIVRGMAEQIILVMGRAAKEYLMEQRAKGSPELQKAIDRIWQRILDEGH